MHCSAPVQLSQVQELSYVVQNMCYTRRQGKLPPFHESNMRSLSWLLACMLSCHPGARLQRLLCAARRSKLDLVLSPANGLLRWADHCHKFEVVNLTIPVCVD